MELTADQRRQLAPLVSNDDLVPIVEGLAFYVDSLLTQLQVLTERVGMLEELLGLEPLEPTMVDVAGPDTYPPA